MNPIEEIPYRSLPTPHSNSVWANIRHEGHPLDFDAMDVCTLLVSFSRQDF